MTNSNQPKRRRRARSPDYPSTGLLVFLEPPPVLPGEDASRYWAHYHNLVAAIEPKNSMERIWVRDIADLTWEILRYRRLKVAITCFGREGVTDSVMRRLVEEDVGFPKSERRQNKRYQEIYKENQELIRAELFVSRLDDLERVERLLASAESRRNATLREIEFHRALAAARLRKASDEFLAQIENVPVVPESAEPPSRDAGGDSKVTETSTS
jgi:hypothetical protein